MNPGMLQPMGDLGQIALQRIDSIRDTDGTYRSWPLAMVFPPNFVGTVLLFYLLVLFSSTNFSFEVHYREVQCGR